MTLKPMMLPHHAEFLDKLVELVPARFYLPDDDDDTEKKWFPGLIKVEKAMAKRETIENLNKAKRDRLDPEKSALTTLDLQKQKLEKEKSDYIKPMIAGLQENDTYEKGRGNAVISKLKRLEQVTDTRRGKETQALRS